MSAGFSSPLGLCCVLVAQPCRLEWFSCDLLVRCCLCSLHVDAAYWSLRLGAAYVAFVDWSWYYLQRCAGCPWVAQRPPMVGWIPLFRGFYSQHQLRLVEVTAVRSVFIFTVEVDLETALPFVLFFFSIPPRSFW